MYQHVLTDCNAGAACAHGGEHFSVYIYLGFRFGAKLQYCNSFSLHRGPLHFQYWSVSPYTETSCVNVTQLWVSLLHSCSAHSRVFPYDPIVAIF